jgi:hypothetical protein
MPHIYKRLPLTDTKKITAYNIFSRMIHYWIVLWLISIIVTTLSLIFASAHFFDVNSLLLPYSATAQEEEQQRQQHLILELIASSSSFPQSQTNNVNNNSSFAAVPATTTAGSNTSSNYLTYNNAILGIKMQYPSDWSVREYSYNSTSPRNVIAGFYSPSKTGSQLGNISGVSGTFVPYLDIFTFGSNGTSLDSIVKQKINNFLNSSQYTINNNESKPFRLKGNHSAYMLDYTVRVGGDEFFRKRQAWTIFDNKVYLITFTSQDALFSNYVPIVEKMINSFEIKTKTK